MSPRVRMAVEGADQRNYWIPEVQFVPLGRPAMLWNADPRLFGAFELGLRVRGCSIGTFEHIPWEKAIEVAPLAGLH